MKIKKLLIISLLLISAINAVNASEDVDLLQNPIDDEILGSTYEIDENNYYSYFDLNTGKLHNDTVISNGDTVKLGNLTNKKLYFNKSINLTKISSNNILINSRIVLVSGSDNSIINGIKIINDENTKVKNVISLENVNNISIIDSYFNSTGYVKNTVLVTSSNDTNIINSTFIVLKNDAFHIMRNNTPYVHISNCRFIGNSSHNSINSNDLTKIEKNKTKFIAEFFNPSGIASTLLKQKVLFIINGVEYYKTTDEYGIAKMNINLEPGRYLIQSKNPVTNEVKNNTITILERFSENNDLEKYYLNNSQYIIKILDDNGKAVNSGEVITFNINGVFYNRTSNNEGYARLNIKLQPGDYIITTQYKGCKVSNKIKVKPVITANDLTKIYGASDQFKVKLVDGEGNPLIGKSITFNINGVFYNRTTHDGGIAKLNIKLQSGKYIITSSYNGANIANKITITE